MESDEVAAVKVLKTGAKPMRARKTNKDDFTTFEPDQIPLSMRSRPVTIYKRTV